MKMASENLTVSTSETGKANIVYILYLAGVVVGITPLIGVIMAYLSKDEAPDWVQTHYRFQIRTFWISLLYGLIGALLTLVFIGFLVLFATLVWYIIRCVKGLNTLSKGEPIADPASWMFG
jgi:uncharacterized membrane protein